MPKMLIEIDIDEKDISLIETHTCGVTFTSGNAQVWFPAKRSIGYCGSCVWKNSKDNFCSNIGTIINPEIGYCNDWCVDQEK